jgi:hypothetical protein
MRLRAGIVDAKVTVGRATMLLFNRFRIFIAAIVLALAGCVVPAAASSVYPFCDASASTGHIWYVDPLRGSLKGDGSKAKPWRTLGDVISNNLIASAPSRWDNTLRRNVITSPNAPIKPGDTIYLMTGNHGTVTIQGYYGTTLVGYNQSQFITIMAGPGQIPVIQQLNIIGGSHFIFRGISFLGTNNTGSYATAYSNGSDFGFVNIRGPHDNIIFDQNRFISAADVSGWSISDWISKRASGITEGGGSCLAITNNTFKNIGFGIRTQKSQHVLIQNNTIDYFTDDGIDYGSDDLTIDGNTITNSIEDGDGFHRDGMQGQPYNEQTTISNVTITNNKVIRIADPRNPYPGFLQGIDAFDGQWSNVTVKGNFIVTDAGDGLVFFGSHNITISGNTVMGDSGRLLPCYGMTLSQCEGQSVQPTNSTTPALRVTKSKTGVPSSNVYVTNNFLTGMAIDISTSPITISGNVCVIGSAGKCPIGIPVNGVMKWVGTPSIVGDNNVITSKTPAQIFGVFNTESATYNQTVVSDPRN